MAKLFHELRRLEAEFPDLLTPDSPTQRVGAAPMGDFPAVIHRVPMLSLGNAFSREDVVEFVTRAEQMLGRSDIEFSVEPKLDVASDVGWRIAGARALIKACEAANTALLEPIMRLEVVVPDEFVGDVLGDLNQRRAQIHDVGIRGNRRCVIAELPLRSLFGYSTAVRSATQGRATYSMEFKKYSEAPAHVAAQVTEARKG